MFRKKWLPKEEGYLPSIYLANLCIPLYFLLEEEGGKLAAGLLLLLVFIILYRQAYWNTKKAIYYIITEYLITIVFSYFYHPMYLFIVFVFAYQVVRLPLRAMYAICGLFTVFCLHLIYVTVFPDQLYLMLSFLPPLFGGGILPFVIRASLKYKEMNEDLQRIAEELRMKNLEKEQLEESKKRMLADLSHDLKTPMTTIQGYSKALYDGLVEDEEQTKRYLKYIHDKSLRVTTLIDELFIFSKLDTPDSQINRVNQDLCEFLREMIVEYYELFDEKEMELEITIPETKIMYAFDPKLFYRVLSNLLENALKYNPERTTIYIELKEENDSIAIEIGDDGTEISEDIVQTLFDPFVRGDKNRMNEGGSGLGLSITKKIIEKHGGSVKLNTTPKQGKKSFMIQLPISNI